MPHAIDRPFVDDDLSSRAAAPMKGVEVETVWKQELPALADFVLSSADRVVVEGNRRSGRWLLFDAADGRKLAEGVAGRSDILVDRERGLFWSSDGSGHLAGYALADGATRWTYLVDDMMPQWRVFLARRGRHLVIVGQDMPRNHAAPTEGAKLEVHELADSDRVEGRYLRSGKLAGKRDYRSPRIAAALGAKHLVVAVRDRIEVLDLELQVVHALDGKFLPEQLSVDEQGTILCIVTAESGRELLRVGPDAAVRSRARLDEGVILAPPLVDGLGRAVIVTETGLTAFDAAGKMAWGHALPEVAGAIVTSDGLVLVASGEELVTLDERAEIRVVARLKEKLVTPPSLAPDGRLYVASGKHLFALAPKK